MIDNSRRKKISKGIDVLNCIINEFDLIDIYSSQRSKKIKRGMHIFLKHMWTFTKINHILGHSVHLTKFNRIQILQSIVLSYNEIK